jgi:hypothetical protein
LNLAGTVGDGLVNTGLPDRRVTTGREIRHPDSAKALDLRRAVGAPRPTFSIEIDLVDNHYRVTLAHGAPQRERCYCQFTASELSAIYRSLCEHAENVLQGSPDALYRLADYGNFVFCEIFNKPIMQTVIANYLASGEPDQPIYIVVHAREFAIPWNFLCIKKPESEDVDLTTLLGHRCVILCDITDPEEPAHQPEAEIAHTVTVLGAHCDNLKYSTELEIPYIQMLASSRKYRGRATYTPFPVLASRRGGATAKANQAARATLFSEAASIVHFACHGENHGTPDKNHFRIRDLYPLSYVALKGIERFKLNPLVFLNACEMGFVDPLRFTNFIDLFLDKGARTVIAPDCQVEDFNSARFARSFYKFFVLGGETLMDSLFKARRDMFQRHGDMIGYAYAIYGQPHARLSSGENEDDK